MKLLVCFKVVRDLDSVIEQDWLDAQNTSFDIDYTKKIINCYDESALETALFLAEEAKRMFLPHIETVALTISREPISDILKNLYAVKFDSVVNIQTSEDLRFNPISVASIIADYVERMGGFDLIFTGYQDSVGNNAQTGFLLAEILHLPCVNKVYDVEITPSDLMIIQHLNAVSRYLRIKTPAILVFENAKHTYLRIATLREKLAASKYLPLVYNYNSPIQFIDRFSNKAPIRLYREKTKRSCVFFETGTAQEKAKRLFDQYIQKTVDIQ